MALIYTDESINIRTPISKSAPNYDSTINNNSPIISVYGLQSPTSSFTQNIFRMSSKYDLQHQPRQYFFYISVICMLYCVVYRLFFYYTLYKNSYYEQTIYWILTLNGFVSIICLSILLFITILVTIIRIHNQCSPENVQILLFSTLRLCVMFILNIIIIIFADSFILFSFISYVFNPSSSSNSHHVDIFWQSIRKYLKDAEDDDIDNNLIDNNIQKNMVNMDDNQSDDNIATLNEKMKRLIAIHYYCMTLYINQTKLYSNKKNYNAGIFGRKQQQKAINRLRPIVFNEYNQRDEINNDTMINFNRFGISTPQSLSSYHRRNFMNNIQSKPQFLKHHDLQIWFSVILWMPCFLNDKRYNFYWLIEKVLLRISLIIILIFVIYTETKCALKLIPITTSIRCVLEIINLLNLIPFVIYDDPDFDNIAELYSSRELSTAITRKKRNDIVREINKCYYNYIKNITSKLSQQSLNTHNLYNGNNHNKTTKIYQSAGSNKSGHQQLLLLNQTIPSHSFAGLTPPPKNIITNNVQDFNHADEGSTEFEEDEDDDDDDDDDAYDDLDDDDDDEEYEDETEQDDDDDDIDDDDNEDTDNDNDKNINH